MNHAFKRREGYAYTYCGRCYALAPARGPCVDGRIARDLPEPSAEEVEREADYLAAEREAIQAR